MFAFLCACLALSALRSADGSISGTLVSVNGGGEVRWTVSQSQIDYAVEAEARGIRGGDAEEQLAAARHFGLADAQIESIERLGSYDKSFAIVQWCKAAEIFTGKLRPPVYDKPHLFCVLI